MWNKTSFNPQLIDCFFGVNADPVKGRKCGRYLVGFGEWENANESSMGTPTGKIALYRRMAT
jgi:hypothetical protein